uniref:Uncharacterized protein n=1 Tax=Anguilla anguilla TaxID=7936 RepID=A0A0E9QPY3_ANGAN
MAIQGGNYDPLCIFISVPILNSTFINGAVYHVLNLQNV